MLWTGSRSGAAPPSELQVSPGDATVRRHTDQVITAQASTLQNQRVAVDILTRRMLASVSLIQALGGDWDPLQSPARVS